MSEGKKQGSEGKRGGSEGMWGDNEGDRGDNEGKRGGKAAWEEWDTTKKSVDWQSDWERRVPVKGRLIGRATRPL